MHLNDINNIGIVARDHMGNFLWGIMGPLKKMEGLQSHIWAIHKAMKAAMQRSTPHIHMESDNM